MSQELKMELQSKDPSPTKKYSKWMLTQAKEGFGIEDIVPTITYFHTNLPRFEVKDIYQYKTLKELEDKVKEVDASGPSNRSKRKQDKSGAIKISEDDHWLVNRIDDKEASVIYGKDTKWCITMDSAGYFEDYSGQNIVFYFILDKTAEPKSPLSKLAYTVRRDESNKITRFEIYNSQDHTLSETNLEKAIALPKEIAQLIETDLKTVPKTFIARIKNNELSQEEIISTYYKYSAIQDEREAEEPNFEHSVLKMILSSVDLNAPSRVMDGTIFDEIIAEEAKKLEEKEKLEAAAKEKDKPKVVAVKPEPAKAVAEKKVVKTAKKKVAKKKTTGICSCGRG